MADKFDCFICGSDQIWNLDCTVGVVEPYFLSFAGSKRRVAYAPSLAHMSFKPENFDRERVARLLSKFDYLNLSLHILTILFHDHLMLLFPKVYSIHILLNGNRRKEL